MWRRVPQATSGLVALLVLGLAGCVDLNVQNPNAPDASRALATPGDVESLIGGGYNTWLYTQYYDGVSMMMSVASGQHAAPWANSGMEYYARIPRQPTVNSPGDANIVDLIDPWIYAYKVISAEHDGLTMVDSNKVDVGSDKVMVQAFGKYMQGLAHGTVALLYDSGYVYTEQTDPNSVKLQPYTVVMDSALSFLEQAATLASSASFTLPKTWMTQDVSSATLAQLAHSYAAIYRADVARTPAERKAADWNQIVTDANAGITTDWMRTVDCNKGSFCDGSYNLAIGYMLFDGWQMQNNWVLGMADQSGAYQAWFDTAVTLGQAQNVNPFLVITPDTRWPQGVTDSAQAANPGEYFIDQGNTNGTWARPDRGKWRWSYYEQVKEPFYTTYNVDGAGSAPEVSPEELASLEAEAAYYAGDMATVANFVNSTRTKHGLNAAAATQAGNNTSCVPRLPDGTCGDLWEMFKWETRLETEFLGPLAIGSYFDSRGWGDLMQGTILEFPVPYREMQLLQRSPYNYGGVGGSFGAPVGTYGY